MELFLAELKHEVFREAVDVQGCVELLDYPEAHFSQGVLQSTSACLTRRVATTLSVSVADT